MKLSFLAFFFALWTVSQGSQGIPEQKCIYEVKKYSKLAFVNAVETVCVEHKCKIAYAHAKEFLLKYIIVPVINIVKTKNCEYTPPAINNEELVAAVIVKKCLNPALSKVNNLCHLKDVVIDSITACVIEEASQLIPSLPNADAYCNCLLESGLFKDLEYSKNLHYNKLILKFVNNKFMCKK